MTVLRKIRGSRKATAGIVAIAVIILREFGIPIDEETMFALVGIIATYILGQGMADSSTQKPFEPDARQKRAIDQAEAIEKRGFDMEEVLDMGQRVLQTKGPVAPAVSHEAPGAPLPRAAVDDARARVGYGPIIKARVGERSPFLRLTVFALLLMWPAVAAADGEWPCYADPWWKGLYDTALYDSDPADRGAAIGELSRWGCHPIDVDGDGRLDPNPDCKPPPECSLEPSDSGRIIIPDIRAEHDEDVTVVTVPRTILNWPDLLERYRTNIYGLGPTGCSCNGFELRVGDIFACTATGDMDGPPVWTSSGNLTLSEFTGGRTVQVRAEREGSAFVQLRETICGQQVIGSAEKSFWKTPGGLVTVVSGTLAAVGGLFLAVSR